MRSKIVIEIPLTGIRSYLVDEERNTKRETGQLFVDAIFGTGVEQEVQAKDKELRKTVTKQVAQLVTPPFKKGTKCPSLTYEKIQELMKEMTCVEIAKKYKVRPEFVYSRLYSGKKKLAELKRQKHFTVPRTLVSEAMQAINGSKGEAHK